MENKIERSIARCLARAILPGFFLVFSPVVTAAGSPRIQPKITLETIDARITRLQATVERLETAIERIGAITDWQSKILDVQNKDRAADKRRDACYQACEASVPWPQPDDADSEAKRELSAKCNETCRAMPHSPGGGGC